MTSCFRPSCFPPRPSSAKVDPADFAGLVAGQFRNTETDITVSLTGQSHTFKTAVSVVKLRGGSLMVTTLHPIIVNAADFDLAKGVDELRKIADLPSISNAVPVSLSLVFDTAD